MIANERPELSTATMICIQMHTIGECEGPKRLVRLSVSQAAAGTALLQPLQQKPGHEAHLERVSLAAEIRHAGIHPFCKRDAVPGNLQVGGPETLLLTELQYARHTWHLARAQRSFGRSSSVGT